MNIIFATSCNEGYYPTALPYLEDIDRHSTLDNRFIGLDWDELRIGPFSNLKHTYLDIEDLKLPLNNWCIQHGEFLSAIPGKPNDVILFTDADIRMQRPFTEHELNWLRDLGPDEVYAGYNAGPGDTLLSEAMRLRPLVDLSTLVRSFGKMSSPCYNVGAMACRRAVWEELCDTYIGMYPAVEKMFGHVARQQWLISYIIHNLFTVTVMPPSFHSHGHYGNWMGCTLENDTVMHDGQPILLRHKL